MSYRTNISNTTLEKRNQIKGRLDNFATFMWRGENAFDICGAFIIADKRGDLKFYNGPSFSNEYTKPQFSSSSGNLTGVNFNRQQIKFKIGAYWFSINEWQDFIEWINAYEVNYLTFNHSPEYGYLVKLANISDSPRYVIGYENNQPRYYTEIDLTWDLQGDSCVRSNSPYEWKWENNTFTFNQTQEANKNSKLPTPLLLTIPLNINEESVEIEFKHKTNTLFKVTLQNMPTNNQNVGKNTELITNINDFYKQNVFLIQPTIQYDSETGVLLYNIGDTSWKLLHLNMTDDDGSYMVKNMQVNKFKLQGDISNYEFTISVTGASIPFKPQLQVYERTNVI